MNEHWTSLYVCLGGGIVAVGLMVSHAIYTAGYTTALKEATYFGLEQTKQRFRFHNRWNFSLGQNDQEFRKVDEEMTE